MEPQATDQRRPPPLFTILTLNTNTRADLAGLPTLLRENRPDFVFIQEVNISLERLRAAVSGLGYSVWLSSADQPKRVIAVLSLHPEATVSNLIPGYLQKVIFEDLAIFHLHAPSDSVIRNKITFFQQIADHIVQLPNLKPILVGDFNCVTNARDLENDSFIRRSVPFLTDYIHVNHFSDAFRVLHPATTRFSWYRRGCAAARLDRIYLPPPLESAPRVARYIPTTSDHHAFLLKLDKTGLSLPDPQRSSASFYWKFNSSLLKEKDFLPTFTDMWQQVAAAVITFPAGPSEWWEQLAKPSISDFCKQFSRLEAGCRAATRRFFTRALELALEAADWTAVAACRKRLSDMDAQAAAGLAVRSGQPAAEEEVPGLFHAAAEGRHGPSPGLMAVRTAAGQVLRDQEDVQQEILTYFEALFQGRHTATAARPEPFDSGTPFTPNLDKAATFLAGLPSLPPPRQ